MYATYMKQSHDHHMIITCITTSMHTQSHDLHKMEACTYMVQAYLFCYTVTGFDPSRPEQVGTRCNCTTLVRFLEELGATSSAVGSECLVVLLSEVVHLFKRGYDQDKSTHLSLGVRDVFLKHSKSLTDAMENKRQAKVLCVRSTGCLVN